ncbi:MAG: DoxX family protein, partial [Burkholderiaceae bacterium]|nr:DoxX family protein [Burkholderiaceae bacterium]
MDKLQDLFALIGRIALAGIFVKSGIGKIGGFAATAGYIASKGLPLPELGAVVAIVVEVVAGIALIVGWKARWAALAIAIFTLATMFLFHPYWTLPADKQYPEMLAFWKNLAIFGGML